MTTTMPDLTAGIRVHPTDEELVVHYLTNQAAGAPCPVPIIAEANIYACNPWELPARALFVGDAAEWYFFSPRDRKYPNGARPNSAAGDGYWKATGTDKPVLSSTTNERVGVKKALVFYSGRPPRGVKTHWIMHEYRLVVTGANNHNKAAAGSSRGSASSSMRLDDWVLCRIYKKSNDFSSSLQHLIISHQEQASSTVEEEDSSSLATNNINTAATLASPASPKSEAHDHDHDHHQFRQCPTPTMSKSCSLTDLLNTIDGSALSQMLLLDDGGPEEVDAHAEQLIYYPPQGTTAHTHQQSLINYNNDNVMNGGGGSSSSSHFISTNNLLPPRAVDACSDNNGLMMKRKQRTMTAMDDGAAGSSLDDDGISKKLMKLLPSDSRNPVVRSSTVGSYCNQLLVVDTNNTAGFQFQFQPSSSSLMTTRSYPFLQMQ